LAIETLNFGKRKREMLVTPGSARRNRALSAFPYAMLHALLTRAAARAGVAVRQVNPAYTSVVGRVKVAPTRGVSTHQGAAFTIARRALGHTEHFRSDRRHGVGGGQRHTHGSDTTAPGAAEQATGTSWKVWGRVHGVLRRQDARGFGRGVGEERPRGQGTPTPPTPYGGGARARSGGDGIPDFPLPSPTGRHAEQLFAAETSLAS
jgi:IS605 OrfB family transposase